MRCKFQLSPDRADTLVVIAIVLLSAIPYISFIGFYSDDWSFLATYHWLRRDGWDDVLIAGLRVPAPERPGQGIYLSALFLAFGLNPLPYHLVNTAVMAIACALLLKLLRELRVPPAVAFATTVIFIMLPQHSTVRIWYAAFQVTLGFAFFLASALCELRAAREQNGKWKLLALLWAFASLACYEIFAPFLVVSALAGGIIRAETARSRRQWARAFVPQISNLLLVGGALVYKGVVAERLKASGSIIELFGYIWQVFWDGAYDWKTGTGLNAKAALYVNFWESGASVFRSLRNLSDLENLASVLIVATVIGVLTYWRTISRLQSPAFNALVRFIMVGFAIFWLGYAIFFVNLQVHFSPTSTGNRTAMAAALGVAVILVGAVQLGSRVAPPKWQVRVSSLTLSVAAMLMSIHISTIADFWSRAYFKQLQIMALAKQDLAAIPEGSTIILDGICPYIGPAITFESPWDWNGMLSVALNKWMLGDVANPSLRVTETAIETLIYDMANSYPFGDTLFIYNPPHRTVVKINSRQAADRYIYAFRSDPKYCPAGYVAQGIPV